MQGNRGLYRRLLADFVRSYADVALRIRAALDGGAFQEAREQVHDLKGVAGNLEARPLLAAAVAVEKALQGGEGRTPAQTDLNAGLDHLAAALDQAVSAVRGFLPGVAMQDEGVSKATPPQEPIPLELARETATHLQNAAEIGDIAELRAVAQALEARTDELAPIGRQINALTDEFDMEGLLKLAGELWKGALYGDPSDQT